MSVVSFASAGLFRKGAECKKEEFFREFPRVQLVSIINLLAGTIFLSYTNRITPVVWTVAKFAILETGIDLILAFSQVLKLLISDKESRGRYASNFFASPFDVCVLSPILEEGYYRFFLQGSLQFFYRALLPSITFSLFGIPMLLSTLLAIEVASFFFGQAHLENDHPGANRQAFFATLSGISYGILYSHFGFWASCLAHIINNTAVRTLVTISSFFPKKPKPVGKSQ
jgi:hypothetical protein